MPILVHGVYMMDTVDGFYFSEIRLCEGICSNNQEVVQLEQQLGGGDSNNVERHSQLYVLDVVVNELHIKAINKSRVTVLYRTLP